RMVDEHAGRFSAGQAEAALQRLTVFAGEEAVLEADADVIPRQARGDRDRAEVGSDVDAGGVEGALPYVDLELIFAGIQARAVFVGALEDVAQRAVAAGEHPFQPRRLAVVHAQIDAGALGLFLQPALLLVDGARRIHGAPLKRRVRLGDVGGDADRDLGRAAA